MRNVSILSKMKKTSTWFLLLVFFGMLFHVSTVYSLNESPQTFTLDGQLFKTGTTEPLLDTNAILKVQIINPNGTCLLYEEQQAVNTNSSNGYFHINVGSLVGASKRTGSDPGRSMQQVFQNMAAITANSVPGQTCSGGAYTPAAGAIRYFRIIVTPSATNVADTLTPDIVMDSVSSAMVAQSVQGLERANILQVANSASTALTQANLEAVFTTPAYTNLQSILAGNFMRQDSSGATLPSYAATPGGVSMGDIWYDTTTNQVKYQSNAGVQTLGTSTGGISSLTVSSDLSVNGTVAGTVSGGSALLGIASISTPGKVSGSAITSGTISGTTGINTSGNIVTTGTLSGLSVQTSNLRLYNGANYIQLAASASLASDISLVFPATAGSNGQVLTTNGSGVLSWSAPTVAGTISIGQGGTNATSFGNNRIIASNGTGSAFVSFSCSLNQVISFDASGNAACQNVSSIFGGILNGGNTTAADISIGTNDNKALFFKTNNTTAMTISQDGSVGIGVLSPSASLDIYKTTTASTGNLAGSQLTFQASPASASATAGYSGITSLLAQTGGSISGTLNGIKNQVSATNASSITGLSNSVQVGGSYSNLPSVIGIDNSVTFTWTGSYTDVYGLRSSVTNDYNGTYTNAYGLYSKIYRNGSGSISNAYGLYIATMNNLGGTQYGIYQAGPNESNFLGGNTGIGISAATSALDISGALTAQGMSSAPAVSASNTGRIYYDYSANKFKVSQNGGAYTDLVGSGGGSGDISNGGNATGTDLTIGTNDANAFKFETGNATAMTISQSGNVGVGTTSPAGKLDVNGAIYVRGQKALDLPNSELTVGSSIAMGPSALGSQTGPGNFNNIAIGYQSLQTATGSINNTALGYGTLRSQSGGGSNTAIGSRAGYNISTGSGNTILGAFQGSGGITTGQNNILIGQDVRPQSVTGNDQLNIGNLIYGTGLTYGTNASSGNLGISVVNPSSALDISGAFTAQGMSSAPAVSATNTGRIYYDYSANKFKVSQNGGAYTDLAGAGGSGDVLNGGNTLAAPLTVGTNDAQPLNFEVGNSTAMTISQSGNIGIGTTSPQTALHVGVGDIRISDGSIEMPEAAAIPLISSDTANATSLLGGGTPTANTVVIGKVGTTNRGLLVGTYDWASSGYFKGMRSGPGAYEASMGFYSNGSSGKPLSGIDVGDSTTDLYAGGSSLFSVSFNVGTIMKTTPVTVEGDYKGIDPLIFRGQYDSNTGAGITSSNRDMKIGYTMTAGGASPAGRLDFRNHGNTNLMSVTDTGNVGIGTTSPTTALTVSGAFTAQGMSSAPSVSPSNTGRIYFDYATNKFKVSENGAAYVDLVGAGGSGTTTATSVSAAAGTVSLPSMTFSGDQDTGFYSNGANSIGVAAAGNSIFNFDSTGLNSTTNGGASVRSLAGSAATPTYSFTNDLDTGWYNPGANILAASTSGAERMRIDANGNIGIGMSPSRSLDLYGSLRTGYDGLTSGNWKAVEYSVAVATDINMGNTYAQDVYFENWGAYSPQVITSMTGIRSRVYNSRSANVTTATGIESLLEAASTTGVITTGYSGKFQVNASATSTNRITTGYALHASITDGSTNRIATGYGVYVGTVKATTPWSFYASDSTAPSYFAGNVGFGTTSPTTALTISGAFTAQGMSSAPTVSTANTGRIYYDYSANKFKVSQNAGAYVDLVGGGGAGDILNGGNTTAAAVSIGTKDSNNLILKTNDTARITVDNAGATTIAGTVRQTSGQITSAPYNNGSAVAFDFNNGNSQYTTANCQAMTLTNIQDGGVYTIAVKGTTSGTCSFSQAGLTFRYSPAQGATASGSHSTYTFMRMGNDVYVTWISLYQ
jgi:hypothetical protein